MLTLETGHAAASAGLMDAYDLQVENVVTKTSVKVTWWAVCIAPWEVESLNKVYGHLHLKSPTLEDLFQSVSDLLQKEKKQVTTQWTSGSWLPRRMLTAQALRYILQKHCQQQFYLQIIHFQSQCIVNLRVLTRVSTITKHGKGRPN